MPFERVLLLSDGNLPSKVDFALPFQLDFEQLPPAAANVGISELSARRAAGGGWHLFVGLRATPHAASSVGVEVLQDGTSLASRSVLLPRRAPGRAVFVLDGAEARTSIEVRLAPEGNDALDADNRAYLELEPARPLRAFVSPELFAYRHALEVHEDVVLNPPQSSDPGNGEVDLIIADRPLPRGGDAAAALFVGFVPEDLAPLLVVTDENASVVDWRRSAALLEHVELGELILLEQVRWQPNAGEGDLEALGYEVLVHGSRGPLLLLKAGPETQAHYMLFHSDRSTLPYRVGFPVLVSNLVRIAMHRAGLSEVPGSRTGVLPAARLEPGETYEIEDPAGVRRIAKAGSDGMLTGVPALRVGRYVVRKDGRALRSSAVSLLQPQETLLASVDRIELEEARVDAAGAPGKVQHSLWSLLTLGALGLLMVEWWFFQRRPGGTR